MSDSSTFVSRFLERIIGWVAANIANRLYSGIYAENIDEEEFL